MEKTIPLRVGQYAILTNPDGKILALERSRSKTWSLPGGRLEADERDWLLALKREILEETGIQIETAEPLKINIVQDEWQVKYCVYFCIKLANKPDIKLTEEHSSFRWVDKDNCPQFEYPFVQQLVKEHCSK